MDSEGENPQLTNREDGGIDYSSRNEGESNNGKDRSNVRKKINSSNLNTVAPMQMLGFMLDTRCEESRVGTENINIADYVSA